MLKQGTRLLGIDPGLSVTGFSILCVGAQNTIGMIESDFLALSSTKSVTERIAIFHAFFAEKVAQHAITDIAIETPFLGKNAQNFLKLGYLRGVVHLLAAQSQLSLHEFSPCQVKQAVTGSGGASKEQVAHMVLRLFPRFVQPKKNDVTDAIAVALCALWHQKRLV